MRVFATETFAIFIIIGIAAIERMNGIKFVTTAKSTNILNCLSKEGLAVMTVKPVWMSVMMIRPMAGKPQRLTLENTDGKKPSRADNWKTLAIVYCQLKVEPKQENTNMAVTT